MKSIDSHIELLKEQFESVGTKFNGLTWDRIKASHERFAQQSNKELVEMLERAKWEFEQFKDAFGQGSLLINEIGQLILKHDKL